MYSAREIDYIPNSRARDAHTVTVDTASFTAKVADTVSAFHRSFGEYRRTPLISLKGLASTLGVASIWLKDESVRFGLDAFKVLGASHAIGRLFAQDLRLDFHEASFEQLRSGDAKARLGKRTFVTATDGNHGRAVAWAARAFGHRAVVYLPRGGAMARVTNIEAFGAEVHLTDSNYDEAVQLAAERARTEGWVLMQDTAWAGYEQIPLWVMQGYLTMFAEALEQLGEEKPTHVFIQAGVGSLAGALQAYLHQRYGAKRPIVAVVEPKNAACFFASANAGDGEPRTIGGALATMMAGLAAGRPSSLAWSILREYSDGFFACADEVTATGMQRLARPVTGDTVVISGEAGAVTTGLICHLFEPAGQGLREQISLGPGAKVLLFSTEGATDPENYRRVVDQV
ncbi:MAG: diaminopropionate ammonia-lyase [Acidiferrobacterales bacterium]